MNSTVQPKKATPAKEAIASKKPTESSGTATPIDAVSLLDADHKKVKKLFNEYNALAQTGGKSSAERRALADSICIELTVHAQIEEEIFYPAARATIKDDPLLNEATVEHASCKDLIAQIKGMDVKEPLFDAKVKVLGEFVDHHVKEERSEMFTKVRNTKLDLVALGKKLESRSAELKAQLESQQQTPTASVAPARSGTKAVTGK